ncbi:cation channel family protein (macronuclear) [Tetrahymena thermophila SB210]|uniref:Cation channel family protein n=1 Tax=Tetrahymena thermophila (strain SB210) TaxID=312017 RepID=W7XEL1_TETTS|nr:cation channel family protein [Tetrahymena thermophila SB210]EWS76177.1 cation channel family protein [Tetrahymena thermophila SB210]|eukprot:XP_012651224.1 cation channel family protein [Tetrahymena thermophila SB210]
MDSQFIQNYERKFKEQQLLFSMSETDEIQHQLSERQADRSRQRYLFEQQSKKFQQSHNGDTEIQENSIQDGTSNTTLDLKQQLSITEGIVFQVHLSPELNKKLITNQNINETIFNAQIKNVAESQQILNENLNNLDNTIICDKEIEQQQTSNIHPSDLKSVSIQDQSNIFISQNVTSNAEQMSQVAQNNYLPIQKRKNIFNNDVWLHDDIFYEKNFKKLETKQPILQIEFQITHFVEQLKQNNTFKIL